MYMTPKELIGPPGIAMLATCFKPCPCAVPARAIAVAAVKAIVTRDFERTGICFLPGCCCPYVWPPSMNFHIIACFDIFVAAFVLGKGEGNVSGSGQCGPPIFAPM